MIGTLIFGYLADRVGRFPVLMATNCLFFVSGIVTPFCNSFESLCVIRFITGLSNNTNYAVFYMLGGSIKIFIYPFPSFYPRHLYPSALEYVSVDKRSLIGNLSLAIGFTLGGLYQAFLIRYVGDWKIFHHIIFAQVGLFVILPL